MNSYRIIYLAIAALFGQLLLPCGALGGEGVTLRFVSIPRVDDPGTVRLRVGKDKTIEIEIPTNTLSPSYKVDARPDWTIVGAATGEGGDSKFEELGSAPALDCTDQLILLVRKGEGNADGFDVIPVDSRPGRFGGGMFVFINATEYEFGGEVGEYGFSVEPGQYSIAKPKPESEDSNLCHGTLYYTKEGKEKPFFSSKWPLSDHTRGWFFIYQDFRTSRLRLHTIRDFL